MKLHTTRFGTVDVEESEIYTFPNGLPGFEWMRSFVLLQPDPNVPISFLQSAEEAEIAFIMTSPFLFYPEYEFELNDGEKRELSIEREEDVEVHCIMTVRDELETATLNLLAPVVLNKSERIGKQLILAGTSYHTKHPLKSVNESGSDNGNASEDLPEAETVRETKEVP